MRLLIFKSKHLWEVGNIRLSMVGLIICFFLEAVSAESQTRLVAVKSIPLQVMYKKPDCRFYQLHCAIAFKQDDLARQLILLGADINEVDSNGLTPLHYAVSYQNEALFLLLLRSPGISWQASQKVYASLMHDAISYAPTDYAALLADKCELWPKYANKNGETVLYSAFASKRFDIAEILLESICKEFDTNAVPISAGDRTLLRMALDLPDVLVRGYFVKKLMGLNTYLFAKGNRGKPVTHWLKDEGKLNLVIDLLNMGLEIDAIDSAAGQTLLHKAIIELDSALSKQLLAFGFDSNKPDLAKSSPLYYAVNLSNENLVELLLANRANPTQWVN